MKRVVLLTVALVLVSSAASAKLGVNGVALNGVSLNGANLNGESLNGMSLNKLGLNGVSLNGTNLNGASDEAAPVVVQAVTLADGTVLAVAPAR